MKEYAPFYYSFLEKARCPVRMDNQQLWTKKAKSILGLEPGLHGQNAIALPLAPPPLPYYRRFLWVQHALKFCCQIVRTSWDFVFDIAPIKFSAQNLPTSASSWCFLHRFLRLRCDSLFLCRLKILFFFLSLPSSLNPCHPISTKLQSFIGKDSYQMFKFHNRKS